jgi:putative hydrolase of the HAD superfamily
VSTGISAGPISTILFDADGVMQRTDDGWHDTLVGLLGDRSDVEGDRFVAAIQHAERPTMDGRTDIFSAMTGVLQEFSVEGDVDVDDILDVWTKIQPHPDMVAAVLELRRQGVQCCLTTNQQAHRARWMRSHLHFDRVFSRQFYSCEMGVAKPDPAYFTTIIEQLDLDPNTVLFLDDTEANVDSARATGIHAEVFARHGGRATLEEILARYEVRAERAA